MNRKPWAMLFPLLLMASLSPACSPAFSQSVANASNQSSAFLKYEVNSVFVGELTHTLQIINPTRNRIADGKLFIPIINNSTARHYSVLYNVNSTSGQPAFLRDNSGNLYAYWNDIVIEPNKVFTAELNYRLISFSINYLVNSSLVGNYDRNSDLYRRYTQPEKLIECGSQEIVSAARNIVGAEENPYLKVQKIYAFVIKHLLYELQEEEQGALWAFKNRVGDCSEYSYLFVALCRATGIPARVQAGFVFHHIGEFLKDGHMWAEYYLENYGWIPVDLTWQQFNAIDSMHFSSLQSVPELIPYANYIFNNTVGPKPKDEQNVQLKTLSSSSLNIFVQNMTSAVQKIRLTEFALSLGKVFGAPFLFSSEMHEAEQKLFEVKVCIQNALDFLEKNTKIAQSNLEDVFEHYEETSQRVWMLIVETFTVYISVLTAIMFISLIFIRRHQVKPEPL